MSQALSINFKSSISPKQRRRNRKITSALCVLALLVAAYFYYQYIEGLTHLRHPVKSAQSITAIGKQKFLARLAQANAKAKAAKDTKDEPAKPNQAGFVESLMSALVPSAEAITLQPEMSPAHLATKQLPAQQAVAVSDSPPMVMLTAEQKRLQVAEDGFGDAMNMAYQYPDRYGFGADENLRAARLGDPILVYQVVQTDRAHYYGQPVKSLLQPANEWIYPIVLDNHIRFMVQVRYDGRRYVLGNGSRGLAMSYDKILERWPASEGYHPQLVINPNMPFYYFSIPELPEQNITDTERMLDFNPSLTPAAVILESWR